MTLDDLKSQVCRANLDLVKHGLVTLTWGNASAVDRAAGVLVIKPSGVDYDRLTPEALSIVELESGRQVGGAYRPSSDTPTHLHLYREFPKIGGVVHTHSLHATSWAQAQRPIPCFGTTHADHFYGPIPVTRAMSPAEIAGAYEHNTGLVITERLAETELDALEMQGMLVAGHGPFAWGATVGTAVENAIALEAVAHMALNTLSLAPAQGAVERELLDRHFLRKHGTKAYYGQR